jgi:hypothetical protein
MGVRTPRAVAVAVATAGLARLLHMANGAMFTNGTMSVTVATGAGPAVIPVGKMLSVPGAAPNVHRVVAPLVTSTATAPPYRPAR